METAVACQKSSSIGLGLFELRRDPGGLFELWSFSSFAAPTVLLGEALSLQVTRVSDLSSLSSVLVDCSSLLSVLISGFFSVPTVLSGCLDSSVRSVSP